MAKIDPWKEKDIKSNTEILVDGYLRLLVLAHHSQSESDTALLELPIEINHLCISFTYLRLEGVGQVIMWRIFNGSLQQYIDEGELSELFGNSTNSQTRLDLAAHCVENEVISALKVILEHGLVTNSGLRVVLIAHAVKNGSSGSLCALLEKAIDPRTLEDAGACLYNAFIYQQYNREMVILMMDKIGMLDSATICNAVAHQLRDNNLLATWRWIEREFKVILPESDWDDLELIYE